jgi:hypothetical protein
MAFDVDGRERSALPVGGSEHFTLARLDPGVRDVGTYVGWAGRWTHAAHAAGSVVNAASRLPVLGSLLRSGAERATSTATGVGPSAPARASSTTVVVARTRDGVGRLLSTAQVEGPSPYDLTAELLAWGAAMLVTGHALGPGVLGPVDAFGFDALERGCAALGLRRVDPATPTATTHA